MYKYRDCISIYVVTVHIYRVGVHGNAPYCKAVDVGGRVDLSVVHLYICHANYNADTLKNLVYFLCLLAAGVSTISDRPRLCTILIWR